MTTQQPLDVCLATVYFYPAYSGPAVRFHRYEPGLRARGIRMRVFTTDDSSTETNGASPHFRVGELYPLTYVDDIPVQRVKTLQNAGEAPRYAAFGAGLVKYLREPANRPDLIQCLNLPAIPQLVRLRRFGVPLVFTRTMVADLPNTAWKGLIQRFQSRLRHGLVDCVVVSSGVMRDALRDIGVRTRIEIIPNGLDLKRFSPVGGPGERKALRAKLGLPIEAQLIAFVGSIAERKGVDVLAGAWCWLAPKYPHARLLLVGPSFQEIRSSKAADDFENKIRQVLAGSGAEERVVFTGAVNNVEEYLRAADIFVFPSRREGMPNVVPEAYGCGVPVVMTPFIGLPQEFGRPGEHYELVERTPEALARAISALLDNPARRQQLAATARRLAESDMDVEKSLDKYAGLYRELAESSKKHRA